MNTKLRKKVKHRDIKLVKSERRRSYLLSEPNYHTTKIFRENLLSIEMKKTQKLVNKSLSLVLPILDPIKSVMYEF